jgi:hypothetical protein
MNSVLFYPYFTNMGWHMYSPSPPTPDLEDAAEALLALAVTHPVTCPYCHSQYATFTQVREHWTTSPGCCNLKNASPTQTPPNPGYGEAPCLPTTPDVTVEEPSPITRAPAVLLVVDETRNQQPKCLHCGRRFSALRFLERHQTMSAECSRLQSLPHECSFCQARFVTASSLHKHQALSRTCTSPRAILRREIKQKATLRRISTNPVYELRGCHYHCGFKTRDRGKRLLHEQTCLLKQ